VQLNKTMTMTEQDIPLTRQEALQVQPNQRVFQFKVNARRAYPVHYFCDNEEGLCNRNMYAICTYHRVWYGVKPDQSNGEPVLGEPALEIHTYDIKDQAGQIKPDSDNEPAQDPIDNEIRRSPIHISSIQTAAPVMSAMRMQPVVTIHTGGSNAPPSRPRTPPQMGETTLASLQNRLNMALR
jgi:hypothetical protein